MTQRTQKACSFSLCDENIDYVMESFPLKHRNKSHWLDDLLTHLRTKAENKPKLKSSKSKMYPGNLDEQFDLLWCAKGKRGPKKKAYGKYQDMMHQSTDDQCKEIVSLLIKHIESMADEIGFKDLHLITYINQERWES